jgi:hypothetical protein
MSSGKKLHPNVQARKDAQSAGGSTPSAGAPATPAATGAEGAGTSNGDVQGSAENGEVSDARPKVTKKEAKARWMAAQERVDKLKKELEEASTELSDSVHGLLDSVGPKFKHGNDVLTVAKRGNTYFLRGRSQEEEIPEL